MEGVWRKAKPAWLLWVATRPSVLTDKELRLFAVFAARQVQHLMTDSRSIAAIDVAERFANGEASVEELETANAAARAAASAAASAEAYATTSAARAAARAAASAARTATYAANAAASAARAAVYASDAAAEAEAYAADAAAGAASYAAAWARKIAVMKESQATWLRENTMPNFL